MEVINQNLANELLEMSERDQAMRNKSLGTNGWDATVDEQNTARLKVIVDTLGWPTISSVGAEAASAAWLLAQHADQDPEFQAACLLRMKQLPQNEIRQANLAYLEDRVRTNTGKPQLYGTQFFAEGDSFGPRPIEDKIHLDDRRLEVGLQRFTEYEAEMNELNRLHQAGLQTPNMV